jgi:glycine betaine/proline transport system permease protein
MFIDIGPSVVASVNAFVEWLIVDHGDTFETFANAILVVLVGIESALRAAPPWLILLAIAAAAYAVSRRPIFTAVLVVLTWLIGCLGLWEQAMQTIAIVLVSVAIAVIIGIPIGVLLARSRRARAAVLPFLDLMQTIPSFVYLIPAAMLFGLGKVPAVLATVVYAMPPLIRLTDLGLRQVEHEVIEASRSFGATRRQMLFGVELPLALPTIMQGINQTTMAALSMVVIASMIGARGLGETVLLGLQRSDPGTGVIGGIAIVILAVVLDRVTQAFGRRLQAPRQGGG